MKTKIKLIFFLLFFSVVFYVFGKIAEADYSATVTRVGSVLFDKPIYNGPYGSKIFANSSFSPQIIGYVSSKNFDNGIPVYNYSPDLSATRGSLHGYMSKVPMPSDNKSVYYLRGYTYGYLEQSAYWGAPHLFGYYPSKAGEYFGTNVYSCPLGGTLSGTMCITKPGVCGSSNGLTLTSAPTSGLCLSGTPTAVTGSGPWNWRCIGEYSSSTASCQALKLSPPPVYDCKAKICSPIYKYARENDFTSLNSDCSTVIGAKTYTNDCSCTGGIFNYSNFTNVCNPPVNATCGSANAVSSLTQPATNLCGDGSVPGVTKNATTWDWTCLGKNGGVNATCSAPIMTNGTCGSANNQTFTTAPTTNLCADGSTPGVTGVGSTLSPWSWTCSGSNGGTSTNCAATMTMPTLNFSVTSPIQKGGTATIAWNTTNAASCWASGGWTGWKSNISNSENITPITESPYPKSITYNMECWNAAGNSTGMKPATLEIQCAPDYTDYRCEKTAPATCSPETCDQTQTGQAFCFQRDENSCNGSEVPRPLSECTANGVTCVADSLVCPQCVKTGNWREVGL